MSPSSTSVLPCSGHEASGDSAARRGLRGTTLPKEMVDRLDLAPGDRVLAVETEDGILLTPYTQELDDQLAATRRAAKRYRVALRDSAG